jgi:hypothetical protein
MTDIYINDPDLNDPEYTQAMEDMHYWGTVSDIAQLVKKHGLRTVMEDVQSALDRLFEPAN